jgi:hypothetical protein
MIDINEINPLDYESFYFIGDVSNTDLKVNTVDGLVPYNDYDVINTESGKIIAFPVRGVGVHNFICNGININLTYFDQMFDILDKKVFDYFKFFLFVNSIELPSFEDYSKIEGTSKTKDGTHPLRCDYGKYGGFPFFIPKNTNPYVISKTFNPVSLSGVCHIAYFETLQTENTNPNDEFNQLLSGRSYSSILKLVYEWAKVSDSDVQEHIEISQKAKALWASLNIPSELEEWLSTQYPPSRLSKYLNGQPYTGRENELAEEMPEVLSDFIKSNCQYRTLTSLSNSHPSGVVIPPSVLASERHQIDTFMYDIVTRNNIDYEGKDYLELIQVYFENKNSLQYSPNIDPKKMIDKVICIQRTLQ